VRTSFHHQSEAQPPNDTLTAATSPDTPSYMPSHAVDLSQVRRTAIVMHRVALDYDVGRFISLCCGCRRNNYQQRDAGEAEVYLRHLAP
jgi:hypothetical protein